MPPGGIMKKHVGVELGTSELAAVAGAGWFSGYSRDCEEGAEAEDNGRYQAAIDAGASTRDANAYGHRAGDDFRWNDSSCR
jgi:hypothetical protein